MAQDNSNSTLTKWLSDKGYAEAEVQKILSRLAQRDQNTLTDSVFDSIGNSDKSLDQLLGDLLRDENPPSAARPLSDS